MSAKELSRLTPRQHMAINEVMDNFDFNKVEEYMKRVGWGWAIGEDDEDGIPQLLIPENSDIRQSLRRKLVHTFNRMNEILEEDPDYNSIVFSSSGGFTVYVFSDDRCIVHFSIEEIFIESDMLDEAE